MNKFIALTIIALLICIGGSTADHNYPSVSFAGLPEYKVMRIVDGDTIEVYIFNELARVQLDGSNAPETVHPERPVEPHGKESTQFLSNLLSGERVYIIFDGEPKKDKYGSYHGLVYRAPDGMFVNLELVRQGYATVFNGKFKYKELFSYYQSIAAEARKGLWGSGN
jgi:micrococcal nuclease